MDNTPMSHRRNFSIQDCQTARDNAQIRENAAKKVSECARPSDKKDTYEEMRQEVSAIDQL